MDVVNHDSGMTFTIHPPSGLLPSRLRFEFITDTIVERGFMIKFCVEQMSVVFLKE
jgi:hypothetical protein